MFETPEGRLLRLERDSARLEQYVKDLAKDVEAVVPLTVGVARLEGAIQAVKDDVQLVRKSVASIEESIKVRDRQSTDERRSMRVALVSLTAIICAALIGGVATVLTVVL